MKRLGADIFCVARGESPVYYRLKFIRGEPVAGTVAVPLSTLAKNLGQGAEKMAVYAMFCSRRARSHCGSVWKRRAMRHISSQEDCWRGGAGAWSRAPRAAENCHGLSASCRLAALKSFAHEGATRGVLYRDMGIPRSPVLVVQKTCFAWRMRCGPGDLFGNTRGNCRSQKKRRPYCPGR